MELSYAAAMMLDKLQKKYHDSEFTITDMKNSCYGYLDSASKDKAILELFSTPFIKQVGSEYSEKLKARICDWFELTESGKAFRIKWSK